MTYCDFSAEVVKVEKLEGHPGRTPGGYMVTVSMGAGCPGMAQVLASRPPTCGQSVRVTVSDAE